ncbi:MAG: hypothetical protein IID58_03005 [Proteobacteria bacterium]|nr:hypothetical protein [Pseudomonadota bacterium]
MFSIKACSVPDSALLARYVRKDTYTDCYRTIVSGVVSHAEYVTGFYSTSLFKLERLILGWVVHKPSTDAEAKQLAEGRIDTFAAWYVESRSENQILMCDFRNRTRSWLMVAPLLEDGDTRTRLYFGSAVVPVRDADSASTSLGRGYGVLLGFHKLYSKALLCSAKTLLVARNRQNERCL